MLLIFPENFLVWTMTAIPRKRMNTTTMSHGTQTGIPGTTVTVRGACAVWFLVIARIVAVKFCGAAAAVASMVKDALTEPTVRVLHCGRNVRTNPESGKPSCP
jgi:hypothetical protein